LARLIKGELMPESLCRLTVASCTDDTHREVDLELPAHVDVGQLLPQIVDLVHCDTAAAPGLDWLLSRPGELPMDESATLNDNDVRDGDLLILTTKEPLVAEWSYCDPCHAVAADTAPVPRVLPAFICVLIGGFGAAVLAWPAAGMAVTSRIFVGTCLALASAAGAVAARRFRGDRLICTTLSLVAVVYSGALGFLAVRTGTPVSGLLLGSAAIFTAAILLLRVTDCGRVCLTTLATMGALIAATATVAIACELALDAGGAALVVLSLATLGFAPRLSMIFSGTTPDAVPNAGRCHRILTGLVTGSSIAAAAGAAAVAAGEGSALRGTCFIAIVALVLLLRARTHVDATRRSSLIAASMLSVVAGFIAAAAAAPAYAHVISVLAAMVGAAALGWLVSASVSPIVLRTVEVVEYVALAAVIPMACWVGGIYGWARGMNLS